jgi:hypothetical protein
LKFREIEEKKTKQEDWRTKLERFRNLEDNKTNEEKYQWTMEQSLEYTVKEGPVRIKHKCLVYHLCISRNETATSLFSK